MASDNGCRWWAFFGLCAVVYAMTAKGYLEVSDTHYSFQTATALVRTGSLAIPPSETYTQ